MTPLAHLASPPSDAARAREHVRATLLADIAAAAASEADVHQMLTAALDRLRGVLAFTGGTVALVEHHALVVRAAVGPFAAATLGQTLRRGDSASWEVVTTGTSCLVRDVLAEGRRAITPIRSWLAVPLRWQSTAIGLVSVDSTAPHAFGSDDVALMEAVAAVLAGPLALAQRVAVEVRRAQQAERLAATLGEVGAAPDLETAAGALVRGALALLGGCAGIVRVVAPDGRAPGLVVGCDRAGVLFRRGVTPPAAPTGLAAALLEGGAGAVVDDHAAAALPPDAFDGVDAWRAVRASVHVPIDAGERRVATLHVGHDRPGSYGPLDLALAAALAAQAGGAVERARLEAERRAAEAALRESEERVRLALEAGRLSTWDWDVRTGVLTWITAGNAPAPLGPAAESADAFFTRVVERDRPALRAAAAAALDPLAPGLFAAEFRIAAPASPGAPEAGGRWIRCQGHVLRDAAGAPVRLIGVGTDIAAERNQAAQQAERARLDGALLVARTVAHEINNALAPLAGFAELLSLRAGAHDDAVAQGYADQIVAAAQRAAHKVQQLQRIVRLEEVASPLGPDRPVLDVERSVAG